MQLLLGFLDQCDGVRLYVVTYISLWCLGGKAPQQALSHCQLVELYVVQINLMKVFYCDCNVVQKLCEVFVDKYDILIIQKLQ